MRLGASWTLALVAIACGACSGSYTKHGADPGNGHEESGADAGATDAATNVACPTLVHADRDGDGRGFGSDLVRVECGEPVPDGFAPVSAGSDCDDEDPSVWRWVAEDRDGDGRLLGTEQNCLGAEIPDGWGEGRSGDCDDGDPNAFDWVYADGDGDGQGDDARPVCAGSTLPSGTSRVGGDCDDADPARNTFAPEQFADGLDSNCDSEDDPVSCPSESAERLCRWREMPPATPAPSCSDAPDLYIEELEECVACGPGQILVAVGNRGGVAGRVTSLESTVTVTQDGRAADVAPAPIPLERVLSPGEVLAPVLLPRTWPLESARLVTPDDDCNRHNDVIALEHSYYECL